MLLRENEVSLGPSVPFRWSLPPFVRFRFLRRFLYGVGDSGDPWRKYDRPVQLFEKPQKRSQVLFLLTPRRVRCRTHELYYHWDSFNVQRWRSVEGRKGFRGGEKGQVGKSRMSRNWPGTLQGWRVLELRVIYPGSTTQSYGAGQLVLLLLTNNSPMI